MTYDTQMNPDEASPRPTGETSEMLARFRAYRSTRELTLRDQLVCQHLHLVHSLIRRFSGLGESLDDLIQEGTIGLLNAVDQYDPDRGVKFSTYASHLITSQIQHYLRDRGRLIRQPAWVQELNTKITRATEHLTHTLGREPRPEELAAHLSVPEQSVKSVLAARELNHVSSLSSPMDGAGEGDLNLLDKEQPQTIHGDAVSLPVEDRMVLEDAINRLKVLEQKVVRLHFFGDLNQTEIARQLGISVNYASYLLRRAIGKIKTMLEEQQRAASPDEEEVVAPLASDIPTFDPVTGVYSGLYLRLRVKEEVARSRRYPTNFALMLVSAQGLGSEEPQQLLVGLGRWLRETIRVVDLAAYLGDGVFALLLPHTGREARVLGERLCQQPSLRRHPLFSEVPSLVLNVGYAVFPLDGPTADTLFDRAEAALNTAVKAGANQTAGVAPRPMSVASSR